MRLSGRGLRCIRGGREVFSGLDFDASAGEALAVTGPNGAGKTSLLRQIAGLLAIPGGSIDLEGGDGELTLPEQAHYLGHRDALKPALSVMENLTFWRDFLGGEVSDAEESLAAVGLDHTAHLPAVVLSAGQRRRLSIARLLDGAAADLAARRADLGAGCGRAGDVCSGDAGTSRQRRHDRRGHACAAGDCRERVADWRGVVRTRLTGAQSLRERRPREGGDPYAVSSSFRQCGRGLSQHAMPGVMGPRLRGDDSRKGFA